MIGGMFLTTCNCDDFDRVTPPSVDDFEANYSREMKRRLMTGDMEVVWQRSTATGPACPLQNGIHLTYGSQLGFFPGTPEYPNGYIKAEFTIADNPVAELKYSNFVPVRDAGAVSGTYYRPGTATETGGVVLATSVSGVRYIYGSGAGYYENQRSGTFSWPRHDTIEEYRHGRTVYSGCCEPEEGDPIQDPGPASLIEGPVELISGTFGDEPAGYGPSWSPVYIAWLIGAVATPGLTVTLTAAGDALGQWLVTKSEAGIELRCNTVVHTFSNDISLTTARSQINATGHWTAVISTKVNQANALVSDLQTQQKYVSTNGCAKLIIVPLNAPLAPSSGGEPCAFSCGGYWKFEKNNGFVDDEEGLKAWIQQPLTFKLGNTDIEYQSLEPDRSAIRSNILTDISVYKPNAYGTGWEFNGQESSAFSVPNARCVDPLSFTDTVISWSTIGCTWEPGAVREGCNYDPCNAPCGPCDMGLCDEDDPDSGPVECANFMKCIGCTSEYDPNRYPGRCWSLAISAKGLFRISIGSSEEGS